MSLDQNFISSHSLSAKELIVLLEKNFKINQKNLKKVCELIIIPFILRITRQCYMMEICSKRQTYK